MAKFRLAVLALSTLVAIGLAGCAATPTKNAQADDGAYEWVTPLGSNVPVKVKKGQAVQGVSPTGTLTAEQTAQAIRGGGAPAPKSGS